MQGCLGSGVLTEVRGAETYSKTRAEYDGDLNTPQTLIQYE